MPRTKTEKQNVSRRSSQCPICQTVISNKTDMPRHMKIHSANKAKLMHRCPYPDCKFENLQKSNVETHIRTHTKAKTERCPDCDFATVDPGSLTRHRKRMHGYVPKARKSRQAPPSPPHVDEPLDASTSGQVSRDVQMISLQVQGRAISPSRILPPIQSASSSEPLLPAQIQTPFNQLARYNPQPPHQIQLPPIRFLPQPHTEVAPCFSRRPSDMSTRSGSEDSESAPSLFAFSGDAVIARRTPPDMAVYRSLPPLLPTRSVVENATESADSPSQYQMRSTRTSSGKKLWPE